MVRYDVNIPKMKQAQDDARQPQSYTNKLRALVKVLSTKKGKQDLATCGKAESNFMAQLKNEIQHVRSL